MTNIEEIMGKALTKAGIKYHRETPYRNGFIADFSLDDYPFIVEADGEKWHSPPAAQKRDRYRDYRFRRIGLKTLRFPGYLILTDVQGCVLKIKKAIKESAPAV